MSSLPIRLIVSAVALAFVAAGPGDAIGQTGPKKKTAAPAPVAAAKPAHRTRDRSAFPPGPVYFGNDYLGDDPDPFIRSQILRDLGIRYGGEP
ncbi:MAG: hypothetical protein Q8M26_02755 [Pseudolabrys sp.]|nr:hypothetical protein [Pseudolabrys sp.]